MLAVIIIIQLEWILVLYLVHQPSNQGFFDDAATIDNKPNLNGIQFLDELKQWNIEWRVINGVLQD